MITTTISVIPQAGKRGVQERDEYVVSQEAFQDHLVANTVPELNAFKTQLNSLGAEVNSSRDTTISAKDTTLDYKNEAETAKDTTLEYRNEAEIYKDDAQSAATNAQVSASQVAAIASIDYGSFSIIDGELILGYFDSSAVTPSIVDGEFILTY